MVIHEEWHGYSATLNWDKTAEDFGILHILANYNVVYSADMIEKFGDDVTEAEVHEFYDTIVWELLA